MWNGNQWIIRSPALFNTIATNEIFWLYYLEQLVILHSSNLYTYRHNFSISATLFQLKTAGMAVNYKFKVFETS